MTNLLLFLLIGIIEWILAILRIRACVNGKALLASFLVFLETMLGLWVFRAFVAGNDLAGIAYAIGGSIGTFLGVRFKKDDKKE
jgi:hypothetical protein